MLLSLCLTPTELVELGITMSDRNCAEEFTELISIYYQIFLQGYKIRLLVRLIVNTRVALLKRGSSILLKIKEIFIKNGNNEIHGHDK